MLVARLGLLPAASLSHDIASDSQRPFAIVIGGGLIADLLMSIFLLPTFYVWWAWADRSPADPVAWHSNDCIDAEPWTEFLEQGMTKGTAMDAGRRVEGARSLHEGRATYES
jgi:hypothetical protein